MINGANTTAANAASSCIRATVAGRCLDEKRKTLGRSHNRPQLTGEESALHRAFLMPLETIESKGQLAKSRLRFGMEEAFGWRRNEDESRLDPAVITKAGDFSKGNCRSSAVRWSIRGKPVSHALVINKSDWDSKGSVVTDSRPFAIQPEMAISDQEVRLQASHLTQKLSSSARAI